MIVVFSLFQEYSTQLAEEMVRVHIRSREVLSNRIYHEGNENMMYYDGDEVLLMNPTQESIQKLLREKFTRNYISPYPPFDLVHNAGYFKYVAMEEPIDIPPLATHCTVRRRITGVTMKRKGTDYIQYNPPIQTSGVEYTLTSCEMDHLRKLMKRLNTKPTFSGRENKGVSLRATNRSTRISRL